jgi:endonuclease YncB( thermonuclease family)
MRWTLLLLSMLACALAPTPLDTLRGIPRVIDGDTIEISGIRGRLEGIDAPESRQACASETGRSWDCGGSAAAALTRLAGSGLECVADGVDRYGRALLNCRAGERDVGEALVEGGHALAYLAYSTRYRDEEQSARRRQAGVWQGVFEDPWRFRKRRRSAVATAAPGGSTGGCRIKGNVSASGRIYHVPGSRDYLRTAINPERGERWFCSAVEAEAAGWRAPRRG